MTKLKEFNKKSCQDVIKKALEQIIGTQMMNKDKTGRAWKIRESINMGFNQFTSSTPYVDISIMSSAYDNIQIQITIL